MPLLRAPTLPLHKPRFHRIHTSLSALHQRLPSPIMRRVPLPVFLIVGLLVVVNLVAWGVVLGVLSRHTEMYATAVLAWSLGLRHALDADHISAIDLMTRRLIASGSKPVTVGTFFSLGHSTIVIITSIATAATSAHFASRFDTFSSIGGIIGTSVSAGFLIILGVLNAYILWKLVGGLREYAKALDVKVGVNGEGERGEGMGEDWWEKKRGGPMFWVIRKLFRLIDRPWKMYPLGVVFGLGFDTSSEIAILGISSIQAAKGTSIWLILCFPLLFTVGMCMIDTIDGAAMMVIYTWCDDDEGEGEGVGLLKREESGERTEGGIVVETANSGNGMDEDVDRKGKSTIIDEESQAPIPTLTEELNAPTPLKPSRNPALRNPLIFLYYSTLLTSLTVIVAILIGTIQLLSLLQNAIKPTPEGKFWDGVTAVGEKYDLIGGVIAGSFVVAGVGGLVLWPRFKRWIEGKREGALVKRRAEAAERAQVQEQAEVLYEGPASAAEVEAEA